MAVMRVGISWLLILSPPEWVRMYQGCSGRGDRLGIRLSLSFRPQDGGFLISVDGFWRLVP